MAQPTNMYGLVVNQVNQITNKLQQAIFASASSIFNDTLVAVILALSICFYIYSKIGKDWNREDFYKIGVWITLFTCIQVVFSFYTNYQGFLQIIQTPITWVYGVVADTLTNVNAKSLNMDNHATNSISMITQHCSAMIDKAKQEGFANIGIAMMYIIAGLSFWIIEFGFIIFLSIYTIYIKIFLYFFTLTLSICLTLFNHTTFKRVFIVG